jgi:hypothetical protein
MLHGGVGHLSERSAVEEREHEVLLAAALVVVAEEHPGVDQALSVAYSWKEVIQIRLTKCRVV